MTKKFDDAQAALNYMTECTLATVSWMMMKKKAPKGELKRQIAIAQTGVNYFQDRGILTSGRVLDVFLDHDGDVAAWAESQKL